MNDYAGDVSSPTEPSGGFIGRLPVVLWQRRWLIVIPAVLCAIAGVLAAYLLPRTYRSSAVLLVESQDLPGSTTGTIDQNPIDRRIAKIRQQILSRPDLVELIQTNDLYNASQRNEPLSVLVDRMRAATQISAVDADITTTGRDNRGSIAFSLSFSYSKPAPAQLVAQTFVDRLLKLDASSSQTEAETNVNFLQDQEQSLKTQVAAIEGQINGITGANGSALGASEGVIPGSDYSAQIAQLRRENVALLAQTRVAVERDPNVIAAEGQLAAVKAIYSDDHPDVLLAQSRLAAARANSKEFQKKGVSTLVEQQIAANNSTIAQLSQQQSIDRGRTASMLAAQGRRPAVIQQVTQLQARADSIRANLARVSASLLNAQSMSKLVEQQRGERLSLVEPPVTPDAPSSPNRQLLIAAGIGGGLALGIGLALLIELILQPIRSVWQLTSIVGEPPLAVVPTLPAKGRRRPKRRWFGAGRRQPKTDAV